MLTLATTVTSGFAMKPRRRKVKVNKKTMSMSEAVKKGKLDIVKRKFAACKKKPNAYQLGKYLCLAAQYGQPSVAQYLVRQGASVNESWYNEAPLHKAAVNGHQGVAELLVLKGARVDRMSTKFHQTPLHLAFENDHDDLLFYLLETWFAKNPHDDRCETVIYEALSMDED